MNNRRYNNILCAKYLAGNSSLQEEQRLKGYISKGDQGDQEIILIKNLISLSSSIMDSDLEFERILNAHKRRVKRSILGVTSVLLSMLVLILTIIPIQTRNRLDHFQTTDLIESLCQITEMSGGQATRIRLLSGLAKPNVSVYMRNGSQLEYTIILDPDGGIIFESK